MKCLKCFELTILKGTAVHNVSGTIKMEDADASSVQKAKATTFKGVKTMSKNNFLNKAETSGSGIGL